MANNLSDIPPTLISGIGSDDIWDFSGKNSSTIYGDALQLTEGSIGGRDSITGSLNSTNYLYGDGDKLLNSVGGDDILIGGNKTNYLYGDAYEATSNNNFSLVGGNDSLTGGNSRDFIYGDAYLLKNGLGGNDTLNGGGGADLLYGDSYFLTNGTGGDDTFIAGADSGGNYLYGDAYLLSQSSGGADTLDASSSTSANFLYGDGYQLKSSVGGNDILIGGTGNDVLYGDGLTLTDADPGDDVLWGGKGNDTLYGDARSITYASGSTFGADAFVFTPGDGKDIIMDFQQGIDKLYLGVGFGASSFDELKNIATFQTSSYQTKIIFPDQDVLTLNGKFTLTSNDIAFF